MQQPSQIFIQKSTNQHFQVTDLLEGAGLKNVIKGYGRILIKPNLVEALDPPITTPAELIQSIIEYLKTITEAEIIIGEGTASLAYDTYHAFEALGYMQFSNIPGVSLVDLNDEPYARLEMPTCRRWPVMHLPNIAMDSFLLSVPVLKAHSLAGVTLTMKNMMGVVPPSKYQQGGGWKKSSFHQDIQNAVADLNRYRTPDFTILDATIGMAEAHLWGPTCSPPVGILAASSDSVAIDAYGAKLLNKNWKDIGHIVQVHQQLGQAEPVEIIEVAKK
jgi:uncharacterized protein (DUF362 family)